MDLVAVVRIRSSWMKSQVFLQFLTSRDPPREIKGRVYAGSIRISILSVSKTNHLLSNVGLQFELFNVCTIN